MYRKLKWITIKMGFLNSQKMRKDFSFVQRIITFEPNQFRIDS